jgi:hypothetical protein
MRSIRKIFAGLIAAAAIPVTAHSAVLGGSFFDERYDYRDFYMAANNKPFRVELSGNPYPSLPASEVARHLLPVLQANKPPPNLTFTYDIPADRPRAGHRLVLVFDPANDLTAGAVCNGASRFKPATAGRVYALAVYCRDNLALSQVAGWATSAAPDDAGMNSLMKDMFNVVFERSTYDSQQHGHGFAR